MALCGELKQSTAVDILLGPFIDDTDGKTAETGLTLDVEVSKNGQALANKNDATTPTHDAAGTVDGYYNCELDATDTGTLGILTVVAHAAGFLPIRQDYSIVTANEWDSKYSTDYKHVDVIQVGGTAQTANDNGADINAILVDTAVIGALGAGLTAIPWNSAWTLRFRANVPTPSLPTTPRQRLRWTQVMAYWLRRLNRILLIQWLTVSRQT